MFDTAASPFILNRALVALVSVSCCIDSLMMSIVPVICGEVFADIGYVNGVFKCAFFGNWKSFFKNGEGFEVALPWNSWISLIRDDDEFEMEPCCDTVGYSSGVMIGEGNAWNFEKSSVEFCLMDS